MVEAKNLTFRYGTETILDNISFTAHPGEITAVIGPNGVGKSTLLKCVAGLHRYQGTIRICGNDRLTDAQHAAMIGYLCQNTGCSADLTVFEVILMGLVNELSFRVGPEKIQRVEEIMKLMEIQQYAGRKMHQLSGGQQQLVFIAQTLIKRPDVLILDEPTSALDLNRQFQLMELIKRVTEEYGFTTMVCHHHLDLVSRFASRVLVLKGGRIYCDDAPARAFTKQMFQDVYGMKVEFCTDQENILHMIPVDRIDRREI